MREGDFETGRLCDWHLIGIGGALIGKRRMEKALIATSTSTLILTSTLTSTLALTLISASILA